MELSLRCLGSEEPQTPGHTSFLGGKPKLPADEPLPTCRRCGSVQTFFFQVAFPSGHDWAGQTLAVFQCTGCFDPENSTPIISRKLFPQLSTDYQEPGADIPEGVLEAVQLACRFPVFPTDQGVVRDDYVVKVAFVPLGFDRLADGKATAKSKVGGEPGWIWTDMAPGWYLGRPLTFLMQWQRGHLFKTVPGAPLPAIAVDPDFPNNPVELDYYELFHSYQLYFFGNDAGGSHHVMMVTQWT